MRKTSGFTIVELLVTLVIVVILFSLGTASVIGLLDNARDTERQEDIAAIARGFETRYKKGNARLPSGDGKGSYPTVDEFRHMLGNTVTGFSPTQVSGGYATDLLEGTDTAALTNPGGQMQLVLECQTSCGSADSTTQLNSVFGSYSDPYIYSPEDASGNICTTAPCVSFTLYWHDKDRVLKSFESRHR